MDITKFKVFVFTCRLGVKVKCPALYVAYSVKSTLVTCEGAENSSFENAECLVDIDLALNSEN